MKRQTKPQMRDFALPNFAELLYEVQQWQRLFTLARDHSFRQSQMVYHTNDPELPLRTIQWALQGAADIDDAPAMAEFLLLHVWQHMEIAQQNPLLALRSDTLQRAWELADLSGIEERTLWYLLLVWELSTTGREPEAWLTLEHLRERPLARLSEEYEALAAWLLAQIPLWRKPAYD